MDVINNSRKLKTRGLSLSLSIFLVLTIFSVGVVSASEFLTKIDFEIAGFERINSLDNSDGTSVNITIFDSSGNVVVSRYAVAGDYRVNMTLTMSGDKFFLNYSTDYNYTLFTKHGNHSYNFTTPEEIKEVNISRIFDLDRNGDFTSKTIEENKVVIDSLTGLMWQDGHASDKDWEGAINYCDNLEYAGSDDWRLPSIKEFFSVIDYSRSEGSFWPNAFNYNDSNVYWTSTETPAYPSNAYLADMYSGGINFDGKDNGSYYARCVRPETVI